MSPDSQGQVAVGRDGSLRQLDRRILLWPGPASTIGDTLLTLLVASVSLVVLHGAPDRPHVPVSWTAIARRSIF